MFTILRRIHTCLEEAENERMHLMYVFLFCVKNEAYYHVLQDVHDSQATIVFFPTIDFGSSRRFLQPILYGSLPFTPEFLL